MILGLIIGKNNILLSFFEKNENNLNLVNYKTIKLSDNTKTIINAIYRHKIKKAYICLSDYYIYYFIYNFENAEESDIEKLIKFKCKDFIPFPIDNANIAYQIIDKKTIEDKISFTIISAITNKNIVSKYEDILSSIGVKNFLTISSTYPLLNLCNGNNFVLINSDEATTTMIFVFEGNVNYIRKIETSEKSISNIIETINFYLRKYPNKVLKDIYSTDERYKNILEYSNQVKIIESKKFIKVNKNLNILKEELINLTPLVGEVMHSKWQLDISTEEYKTTRMKKKRNMFYLAGIILLFVLLIFNISIYNKTYRIKKDYYKKTGIIKETPLSFNDLNEEFSYINNILEKKNFSWSKFLSQLENAVPDKISITSVTPSFTGGNVRIEGMAFSIDDLVKFVKNLQSSGNFKDVFLNEQRNTSFKNVNFLITFKYINMENK